jgi:hypothetical protein
MKHTKTVTPALGVALLLAMAACDGKSRIGELGGDAGRLTLQSASLGRLVDVYAYQRIDQSNGDRRIRFNRRLELVAANVVVNPNLETQTLFDAAGEAVPTADYAFRPFDRRVGHEEMVILWDNRDGGPEADNFKRAFAAAQTGLVDLAAAYRGQNTQTHPIPIVPRNAAVRLQFDGKVGVDAAFFRANPSAIQLLEFKGDPTLVDPADAFRVLPYRVIPKEDHIVLDTTILGGEAEGGLSTPGLPASSDSVTANIRIAIPARGSVVSTFYVKQDGVANLNASDSSGRSSVIRDFRSGNLANGSDWRLREPEEPMIVGSLGMGITAVDTATNTITLHKRLQFVPVRARYPFVDGPLESEDGGIPAGPLLAPVTRPLAYGDFLTQEILVEMPDGKFETVSLRAEILQNLEVGTVLGDPRPIGLTDNAFGGTDQGERIPVVRVRVASVFAGKDSLGREHAFRANQLPTGQDCVLRAIYYEDVPMIGAAQSVSDRGWRQFFVRIDPKPTSAVPGTLVQPTAAVAIEFTKPMDLDQVDNSSNLLVTNTPVTVEAFSVQMGNPKTATARVVPTRLSDLAGDGTVLRLQPPMGFYHAANQAEAYSFHLRLGTTGVTDLAGQALQVFDRPNAPQGSWSVDFSLAPTAPANLVGWRNYLFEAEDEDGSPAGSADLFGQYRLQNGRLTAAATVRFSRSADNQNMGTISRVNRGECWDAAADAQLPFNFMIPTAPVGHPGTLYWQPFMVDSINPPFVSQVWEYWQTIGQPVGRVVEPHKPQGSRMQMRYLEDDFSLDYRAPSEFAIDVEQLYWSTFADEPVRYDVFDRYTMSLAHSPRRPDIRCELFNGDCWMIGQCMNSSLSLTFSENVLPGTKLTPVFEDKIYRINPNDAFRTANNVKYVPYPRFDRTYTWRDSRLVTVDASGNVIGLGGAQQPNAQAPNDDFTANIDSPWVTSVPDPEFIQAGFSTWVMDAADFRGNQQLDHDPIALPLLVDFKVYTDGQANGLATGSNGFQMAMLGSPSNFTNPAGPVPNGYYDSAPAGYAGRPAWPRLRVHTSGGENITTPNQSVLVDVANVLTATGGSAKDAGMGGPGVPIPYTQNTARSLFIAPPGDGMIPWARADFVRKTSTMTFGFFDSMRPQWRSTDVAPNFGIPTFLDAGGADTGLRIRDMVVQLDPPQARQPAGTTVVLELRGADTFERSNLLYDPATSDDPLTRGNLLNVNYACEAYRYSTANTAGAPRVAATGLTRYVTEDQVNALRSPATGLMPRFLNLRLVMTNNVDVSPALSPSLRSMNVVYRMEAPQ